MLGSKLSYFKEEREKRGNYKNFGDFWYDFQIISNLKRLWKRILITWEFKTQLNNVTHAAR